MAPFMAPFLVPFLSFLSFLSFIRILFNDLQLNLCTFQCPFWHLLPQYDADLHPEHTFKAMEGEGGGRLQKEHVEGAGVMLRLCCALLWVCCGCAGVCWGVL